MHVQLDFIVVRFSSVDFFEMVFEHRILDEFPGKCRLVSVAAYMCVRL